MNNMNRPFDSLEEPAKEEVQEVLENVVENFEEFYVGEIQRRGSKLEVELHSNTERRKVTVTVDDNP